MHKMKKKCIPQQIHTLLEEDHPANTKFSATSREKYQEKFNKKVRLVKKANDWITSHGEPSEKNLTRSQILSAYS